MALEIVVLAAGQGSRMKSDLPKVMHRLAGQMLLEHVLTTADQLQPQKIHIVVGHQADRVSESIDPGQFSSPLNWVLQQQQLGTGHAVLKSLPDIDPAATVLIMAGDVPAIRAETLRPLCNPSTALKLLTAIVPDASGFGHILRDPKTNKVTAIVEHKDANDEQRAIREINTGVMAATAAQLDQWLSRVGNQNKQQEYYLPDIIALAVGDGFDVEAVTTEDILQVSGINSRAELASLERHYQHDQATALMSLGLGLADPQRFDLRGTLSVGQDCFADINTLFEGEVNLGNNVHIGPNVIIRDSHIGDGCRIEANSIVDSARIEADCQVGPYARIRPDSELRSGSRIGNFVEIKKSVIGEQSKVNHLAYVGDSTVGRDVNIGAGVITCNYDGAYKHQTTIGDDVFVGSDCQLVAPVTIGAGATIGAGSTITRDVAAGKLCISRSNQIEISNWRRPAKEARK